MSLHGELRAVLFGEETEVVIDFLKERGRKRKDVPTMRHRDAFQCQSKSKR